MRHGPAVPEKSTLVLGVGNILLSDEGVGVHVVRRLGGMDVPPEAEIVDGGTGGYELIEFFRNKKKIIIIDCLNGDAEPGSIIRASPDQLDLQWGPGFSLHQYGLRELLHHASSLTPPPEIIILGVVPENTGSPGLSLSKAVEAKVDRLIAEVLELVSSDPAQAHS